MTKGAQWVAYVGPFHFPWGQPGSRRVYGMTRSLAAYGHDVVVVGGTDQPSTVTRLDEVDGPGSVFYLGLGELPRAGDSLFAKAVQITLGWGRKTVGWIDAQRVRPSHVIVYGGGAPYMAQLRRWGRHHRIPIIADVVEWYDPKHMHGGLLGPAHISAKTALRYHYPRCDGIIAISSCLERHFRSRGCRVLRVPPTLDARRLAVTARRTPGDSHRLTLVYAGTPGKKDLLANIIRAVEQVDGDGSKCELRIFGPSGAQVRHLLAGAALPPGVRVLGQLRQPDVAPAIQEADFSILLREPMRFAEAGFPTKFCESLANGTPVIANITGDLGHYLRDGHEGLVCHDHSVDALSDALRRALRLTAGHRAAMRAAARERALSSFDFRNYTETIGDFLDVVRGPGR